MEPIERFQQLLRQLFQFESSDLDFGIYRILNYKRQKIEKFINEELKNKVEQSFEKYKTKITTDINKKLEELKEEIKTNISADAFTPTGDLKENYKNTNLGKKYILTKEQKDYIQKIDEIKLQVFNDLYTFFSRYYEEGDFIPLPRYSSIKTHRYAIPYNGEEVVLYWATKDQYYIKTGLLFRDYTFKVGDFKVIFRIVEAKEELGSNKATKQRYFVLDNDSFLDFDKENKTLIIKFQYRELLEKELLKYKSQQETDEKEENNKKPNIKQERVNEITHKQIVDAISKLSDKEAILLSGKLNENKDEEKTILLYHLNRFTAKNTKDYFIHKDLKKFLTEQLEYFIKQEVLSLETLEEEKFLYKHITRAKVVKEIADTIICFLAQLEDFQKKLWEKKKFVLKTEYVITTDRIPEEFYDEILRNKEQKKEWQELGFELPQRKEELKSRKLPIDTKHFSLEFKEKLLEKLTEKTDLDDLLDGVLIKSENWQALNLLLEKYKEKIQTIYIDPPFNKEQDADYLYNVKYKDSTWASMLENRLKLAKDLLSDRGSIFVRCDYNGNWIVRPLMDEVFGRKNFRNEIIIAKSKEFFKVMTHIKKFSEETESLIFYSKTENITFNLIFREKEVPSKYEPFLPVYDKSYSDFRIINGEKFYSPKGRKWGIKQEDIDEFLRLKKLIYENGKWLLVTSVEPLKNVWIDYQGYSRNWGFNTENSEIFVKRVVESTSNEGDLVLDFFLGSGTTTAVAHKLKRKWIGVEMGEHFWSVVLPRMKKVLFYDKSGISKEKDVKEKYNEKTSGGFFKYHILEQYEDTLDNIELKENKEAEELFKDDYLIKYFLDYETNESPCFLNIEKIKDPFMYKLKVNLSEVGEPEEVVIDLVETFNYLLGLKVKKIKVRSYKIKGKNIKYCFILAEKDNRIISVVWRAYDDSWDEEEFKEDRDFINQELKDWQPQVVYINGPNILTPKNYEINYIEVEFKKLMFGKV